MPKPTVPKKNIAPGRLDVSTKKNVDLSANKEKPKVTVAANIQISSPPVIRSSQNNNEQIVEISTGNILFLLSF